jgi:hypothetical protein
MRGRPPQHSEVHGWTRAVIDYAAWLLLAIIAGVTVVVPGWFIWTAALWTFAGMAW